MDGPAALPSSRLVKSALIDSVRGCGVSSTTPPDAAAAAASTASLNPLLNADDRTKTCLLTLHALFPNEVLPALDLLDRNLVMRPKLISPSQEKSADRGNTHTCSSRLYYVRSAQSRNAARPGASKHRSTSSGDMERNYEVRLDPWTCSCPAFAFSAFPADAASRELPFHARITHTDNTGINRDIQRSKFGGLSKRDSTPICKHLLACYLASEIGMFASFIEEREATVDELAAWAAGWGD